MTLAHDLVAAVGEFVGTFLFLFLGEGGAKAAVMTARALPADAVHYGTVSSDTLMYVSLSFGLSLTVVAWVFFRVSGSLFNPAISLALLLAGALPWRRCILLVAAQFAGGIAANGMLQALTPDLGPTNISTLAEGVSVTQGIFLEAILAAALVFSVLMLAAEKHRATYLAPVGIGLTLFVAHLTGAMWTGAAMNPARALGPSVVQRSFPSYHWIYYVGPFLGSIFALAFYILLKACDYAKVVAGQDDDHLTGPAAVSLPAAAYGRARAASVARHARNTAAPVIIQLGKGDEAVQIPASVLQDAFTDKEAGDLEAQAPKSAALSIEMDRTAASRLSQRLSLHLPTLIRTPSAHSGSTAATPLPQAAALAREASSGTFIIVSAPHEDPVAASQSSGAMLAPGSTLPQGLMKDVLSQ